VGSAEAPLRVVEETAAALAADCVRIDVSAAALNFADALVVQGLYQEKPLLPFTPGGELSGVVSEVGSAVRSLAVGDRVLAVLPRFGAFSESCIARETDVFPLPASAPLSAAAGLAVAYGTAHVALAHRCSLRAGQTLLVLGAAGGVGIAAIQIGLVLGARVAAVARGAAKAAALRAEGAELVIDSESLPAGGLKAALRSFAPKGVDVIFDPVGGALSAEALKCAAWGAQVAIIGFASGNIPKLPANVLLVKNITAHGLYWGSYAQHQPRVLQDSLRMLAGWLADGKIAVRVSHELPLERAHEAFKALLERQAVGKVLLVMQQPARARL